MIILQTVKLFAQAVEISTLPQPVTDATFVKNALSIAFAILGGISVVIVIIAGIQYIGSRGEPQAVAKAKSTIIYALVGVAVAVFAVTIVQFTVGRLFQ